MTDDTITEPGWYAAAFATTGDLIGCLFLNTPADASALRCRLTRVTDLLRIAARSPGTVNDAIKLDYETRAALGLNEKTPFMCMPGRAKELARDAARLDRLCEMVVNGADPLWLYEPGLTKERLLDRLDAEIAHNRQPKEG
jgi:hypothetical protein